MKIIDLLNKIANGEEVPKKIKYVDDIYINIDEHCYFCEETNETLSQNIYAEFSRLNDEVEIIEEDKKIERMTAISTNSFNQALVDKINEIIDVINRGD